ncbi:MAG: hypothetical protein ABJL28_02045 [Marinomonas sp.]
MPVRITVCNRNSSTQAAINIFDLIHTTKVSFVEFSTLDRDSLHIHVSVLAYLLACFVLRAKAYDLRPWFAVIALAVFGEYVDGQSVLKNGYPDYPNQATLWHFHGKDMINTMIAPTILWLAARFTRVFEKRVAPEEVPVDEVENSDEN